MLLSFSREYALSLAGSHSTMLSFLFDYDLLILAGSHLAMLSQYKYKQGVIRLCFIISRDPFGCAYLRLLFQINRICITL